MVETKLTPRLDLLDALRSQDGSRDPHQRVQRLLQIVRAHLGLDVGFVSEFVDGRRVFRQVDAGVPNSPVAVGGSDPLEESYCQRVVDGRVPELMTDAAAIPAAAELPVTSSLPVGAHLSVTLRLPDGQVYGTFCCFSFAPDETLNARDLATLRAFADIAAEIIYADLVSERTRKERRLRIEQVLAERRFSSRYQPIYRLADGRVAGFEALTRFTDMPYRTPDVWFQEAAEAGLAVELELMAVQSACEGLPRLPADTTLAVNLSPPSILSPEFSELFAATPLDRIVLEVTEHAVVGSYADLSAAIRPFRERGLRLAVDDAGAGHSSFRHVLDLRPDIIKLDMSLTRDIDRDAARHALATALTVFGRAIGAQIVAEGVETQAELQALRLIGVDKVQGYLLSKPLELADAVALPGVGAEAAGHAVAAA